MSASEDPQTRMSASEDHQAQINEFEFTEEHGDLRSLVRSWCERVWTPSTCARLPRLDQWTWMPGAPSAPSWVWWA